MDYDVVGWLEVAKGLDFFFDVEQAVVGGQVVMVSAEVGDSLVLT